jgi:hypothetical protein
MKTVLLVLLVFLLSSFSPAFSQGIDTCSLLKQPEVQSAIGRSVAAGLKDAGKMGEVTFSHCTYKDRDLPVVLLTVYTYEIGKAEMKKLFESAKKQAGDAETLSGLGDDAYWWKSKTTLFVIKDKYMVSLFLGSGVAKLEAAQNMAQKVVQRLP